MNPTQIQENLEELVKNYSSNEFIYDLLRSYGLAKASITRLKKGEYNLSNNEQEVIWKNKVYYKEAESEKLYDVRDELSTNKKVRSHDLRFIIVTDHERLLAEDTKTKENRDIAIGDLPKHFDFFLPWAGMEKRQHVNENPADVKAAEKLAKLYDEIKKNNTTDTEEEVHSLNVFLSRLLFCFFAEDTGIFDENTFTNSVSSHTKEDGSDLNTYFEKLFDVLNDEEREGTPAYLNDFPYVNGGLFKESHPAPEFTRKSRQIVIESGELDWAAINPDIFGSMMQAVITPDQREGLGMHYTSVPNIMKVIEPLFLNDLYDEFEQNKFKPRKLHKLLDRISKFKIFDPACGSGNFLIIAYKQLRYFEIKVLKQLQKLQEASNSLDSPQKELIPKSQLSLASSHQLPLFSRIQLSQFYGIEIDDFAHEIAQLSLWLAEHQMNAKFHEEFGQSEPTLPLKDAGNIEHGNATRMDWDEVCEPNDDAEIFLLGNPPYLGSRNQDKKHKSEMSNVFKGVKKYKSLDYIAIWFYKAAKYIKNTNYLSGFVTTNSIVQGSQVGIFWPLLFKKNIEIAFAVNEFKWTNNAKSQAGVTVVIIGLKDSQNPTEKRIYENGYERIVENVSPYLTEGGNVIIDRRSSPLSNIPEMIYGNEPREAGHLRLTPEEKETICNKHPEAEKYIMPVTGANELINGIERYCLWLTKDDDWKDIPEIKDRVEKTRKYRLTSKRKSTNKAAKTPHLFTSITHQKGPNIVIPVVSSEDRTYIPIGLLSTPKIVLNSAQVIYDPETYIFGILNSKLHNLWVKRTAGKLESRIRYSSQICWNAFPFPEITTDKKQAIEKSVFEIIRQREKYSEKSLADLYDPEKMPKDLKDAHHQNDKVIESCYQEKEFHNDEERLEVLLAHYEQMIRDENINI